MNLKTITTKLETAEREDISPILDAKALSVGATQTVDYVGFAIENIENSIDRIEQAIKELNEIKKSAKAQLELVKIGVSDWMTENGIDKLSGDRISSITVFDKKETQNIIIDNEEDVINAGYFKMVPDKTSAKQALQNGAIFDGAHIEIIYNEASIKLNKKRVNKNEDNT